MLIHKFKLISVVCAVLIVNSCALGEPTSFKEKSSSLSDFDDNEIDDRGLPPDYDPRRYPMQVHRIPLLKGENGACYAEVSLDQSSKVFKVLFDTTTAEIFLSRKPRNHKSNDEDDDDLSELEEKFGGKGGSFWYNGTTLTGQILTQQFTLRPALTRPVATKLLRFWSANNVGNGLKRPYDGVIGISPRELSRSGLENFMLSLIANNDAKLSADSSPLDQRSFKPNGWMVSFLFNEDRQSKQCGVVVTGWILPDLTQGSVHYHPLVDENFWLTNLKSVKFGPNPMVDCDQEKCQLLFDTRLEGILGPNVLVEVINHQLGARYTGGKLVVDCDRIDEFESIQFKIDGQVYTLEGRHYIKKSTDRLSGKTICESLILPSNKANFWVAGRAFMTKYYTTFEFGAKKIGFNVGRQNF